MKVCRYSDGELLVLLRKKVRETGRVPFVSEIIKDKRFPALDTFAKHFGSWARAVIKAGFKPRPRIEYPLETLKNAVLTFYRRTKRPPTVEDFEATIGISHKVLRKKSLRMTYNQLLTHCGLPIHTGDLVHRINRQAEIIVKKELVHLGHSVVDLTAIRSDAPYSFLVDGRIRLHVSGSHAHPCGTRSKQVVWTFSVPKRKQNIDYVIGVGIAEKRSNFFVFPHRIFRQRSLFLISLRGKSKYSKYFTPSLKGKF